MTSIFGNVCNSHECEDSGDSGGGGSVDDPNAWKIQGNSQTTDIKLGTIEDNDLRIITEDVDRLIIEEDGDLVVANSSVLHSRQINMTKVERFTNQFTTGITFSNDRTEADLSVASTSIYTTALIAYSSLTKLSAEIKILDVILNTTVISLGCATADQSQLKRPLSGNSEFLTITGLQRNDILKIEIDQTDDLNRTLNIYKNDVLDQTTGITLGVASYRNLRVFLYTDAAIANFSLLEVIGNSQSNLESYIKTAEQFSMIDYQDNKFLEHNNDELILGSGSTTDVIRLVKPIEGDEGQEFEPIAEVITAMGANIDYTFDENSDQQTITVNTTITSSSIPNILPFRPTTSYNRSASVNFIVENLEVISSGSIGVGVYTNPPFNYETATGAPSSLYGNTYVSFNSSGTILPASLDSIFTVIYRASRPIWNTIDTHDLELSLTSEQYEGKDGLMLNFTVNDVLAYTVFAEVLDTVNPNNSNYEIFYLQPTRGTIKFDTDLANDASNVEIQGYEVKKEFDRLLPYDNTSFNVADSAGIGVLSQPEYIIDFDNGSNNDYTITQISDTEINAVKATNTDFSISFAQNTIDVSKYDWVIECILNTFTGSSCRFQVCELQYVPTTNAEDSTDGVWGDGYFNNFRPGSGSLYSVSARLNGVNNTSSIIGSGAQLDKMRYTIVDGLLTAEYQLSTDATYQPSPVLNVDLLGGSNNLYYVALNDSQTVNGGFDVNVIFTRTERTIETPSIQLNDDSVNIINFQGDVEIKSNATAYMDMMDSQILLNQPLMLRSGDTAYMLALGNISGLMFWNSEVNKMVISTDNTWLAVGECVELVLSEDVDEGNIMELVPSGSNAEIRKATGTEDEDVIAVICWKSGSEDDIVACATRGEWSILCEGGAYDNADRIGVDSIDGVGRVVSSEANQPFAFSIEDKTLSGNQLLKCIVHTQETY